MVCVSQAELRAQQRDTALSLALQFPRPSQEWGETADQYFAWLAQLPAAKLTATVTVTDSRGQQVRFLQFNPANGVHMTTTMQDIDTIDIVLSPTDAEGVALTDQLAWVFSDGGSVITWTIAPDTHSAHGVPTQPISLGEVIFTVTDPSGPSVAAFTGDITLTASAPTQITGTVTVNPGANAPPAVGP